LQTPEVIDTSSGDFERSIGNLLSTCTCFVVSGYNSVAMIGDLDYGQLYSYPIDGINKFNFQSSRSFNPSDMIQDDGDGISESIIVAYNTTVSTMAGM
jgi:hypothetical protein